MRTLVDQKTGANAVNDGERELTMVEFAAVKALRNNSDLELALMTRIRTHKDKSR